MQVTETLSQGLKREYKVLLAAKDLAERLETQLVEMKDKVRINGFRPGKAPLSHLRKLYGRSIMGDVVQNAVNDANRKIIDDNGLRLAAEPKLDFPGDQAEMEKVMEAQGDLAFTVALEVLPKFEIGAFDDVELERPVADIQDADIDTVVERMASQSRKFEPKAEGAEAANGDKVTIDFTGKLDDVPFEGGTGGDVDLVLGSGSFIPGFEEQLVGMKQGDERTIDVTFPEAYNAPNLAGKAATFDVTVKAVAAPGELVIDDELGKAYGFEDLAKFRDAIRDNLQRDFTRVSRERVKRALLDALDKKYSFDLPESLVTQEFAAIWNQVEAEQKQSGKTFEDEGTTEEEQRAEYNRIAERRVRLGLVMAEIGEKAGVQVTDDEVTGGIIERARMYPGQEKMIWDFYRKNPQALAEIRAPIFEEKVVDHIVAQAKVTDKTVSREELFKVEDAEDGDAAKA
jgi:trigger factor